MTFDFERIKVVNMLKKMKITESEFKGVLDKSTAKLWPFGGDKDRLINLKRKNLGDGHSSSRI